MHGIDELSSMTMRRKRERDKEGNFMTLAALLSMEGEGEREVVKARRICFRRTPA